MRASPAFQISLTRFGMWRLGVWMLTALGLVTLALWLAGRPRMAWVDGATLASGAVLIAFARSLTTLPPVDLGWDGHVWTLRPVGRPREGAPHGVLHLVIDLGPWMLLRFDPAGPARPGEGRRRSRWLPLQRRGLEPQWHALRCAVCAPRPAPPADAAAE